MPAPADVEAEVIEGEEIAAEPHGECEPHLMIRVGDRPSGGNQQSTIYRI